MKVIAISDTHGHHRELADLPKGDVLLHGGDVCNRGNAKQAEDFVEWFAGLDYQLKIFISGNHDFDLETGQCLIPDKLASGDPYPENMIHLVDQQVEFDGLSIWGAATKVKKDLTLSKFDSEWSTIPTGIDILITHYPPRDILDINRKGVHCGLKSLKKRVGQLAPSIHLFGDVHASYGKARIGATRYYNASLYAAKSDSIVNAPFSIEL